ncbi:AAA family ATPase [Herbaspirillum sp. C7C2]|uniref:AAA family ATPase n=1 Tax=Herbaspirillum sp. C7C2 TaxID=2736666 RepID=UPI001F516E5E|nr:AAA family ATPase [Herbaspirillum sp. C7C2]MCI1016760.1 AAA family ATPase [Herbaspirillum sp. C7C2]
MLSKIIRIANVGILKNAVLGARDLKKLTLIYADNAHGKSTFASLLNACVTRNASEIERRRTFGGEKPSVNFRFGDEKNGFHSVFEDGKWSGTAPTLYVFNQEFIERNVYASEGVTPEQRASLLDLAIGESAVNAQAEYNRQNELQREKAAELRAIEEIIDGYKLKLRIDAFINLKKIDDVDEQLQSLEKQIGEAINSNTLLNAPVFRPLPEKPKLEFDALKRVLESTLTDVQADAEDVVMRQISKHGSTEAWLHEGLEHEDGENCPFCGQDIRGIQIFTAYKAYFSEAYNKHKAAINSLMDIVQAGTRDAYIASWLGSIDFNAGITDRWHGIIEFQLPSANSAKASAMMLEARRSLASFAERKQKAPLERIDGECLNHGRELLAGIDDIITSYNKEIDTINKRIDEFKKHLAGRDVEALKIQRNELSLHKIRHDPKVQLHVDALIEVRAELKSVETAKIAAKTQLDGEMVKLLATFQTSINEWLAKFHAPFKIQRLASTYTGGNPRSNYAIAVRGATVSIGPGDSDLTFHTALSEGDKRTLAFAFFLAQLFAAPDYKQATVVLDDVFTSLDHHRRNSTTLAAVKIAQECSQLIVFGHDAQFLRTLRKKCAGKVDDVLELFLKPDQAGYSKLDDFNIDEYCASDYFKNYMTTEALINGTHPMDKLLDAAKALRPLVEGHLHKSFPKKFIEGQTFGQMLDRIRNAPQGSALAALQHIVPDLVDFNDYAASFHHDTMGGHPREDINATELRGYATVAMNFIQTRKPR